MSRDLDAQDYYLANGGMIPFKWTSPEVNYNTMSLMYIICLGIFRLYTIGSIPMQVMCGAMVSCSGRYGVLDKLHTKTATHLERYIQPYLGS